jgi:hypothetical protein
MQLMVTVQGFDTLLQAYGDEEANADGGDVDEEVSPVLAAWWGGWTSSMGAGSCGVSGVVDSGIGTCSGCCAWRGGAGSGWGAGV